MRAFAFFLSVFFFSGLQAQTQVIVPFPPGGALDALARMMAQTVAEQTKETVVVENRAGANGLIGAKVVAGGRPDGRMWLFADASTMTVNPSLYPKDPAFDAQRDLRTVLALGFKPAPGMSSDEALRWIAVQHDKWAKLILGKGIRAE